MSSPLLPATGRGRPLVGFHASHEQIGPRDLLAAVEYADQAGFRASMCSDHFAPWGASQGESGFAWSWLGSALQASNMSFGVINSPGQRYHPAIIAQAIATLASMYPGRFWVAFGSGQALNEHITDEKWLRKSARNARLRESVDIIRALLAGEEVTSDGLVAVDRARLWSLPEIQPNIFAAAVTPPTAAWAAGWANGLATVNQPERELRATIDAYRQAGGMGPVIVQTHVSLASTMEDARAIAHDQWRNNVFGPSISWDIETPEAFDDAGSFIPPREMDDAVFITTEPERIAQRIHDYASWGADAVYLHHVGKEQHRFIDAMAESVLPDFIIEE